MSDNPATNLGPLRVQVREPMPHTERGRLGALKKWGGRRIVRLDQLDPRVREAVLALIRADEQANEKASAVTESPADARLEVRRASDERPAA